MKAAPRIALLAALVVPALARAVPLESVYVGGEYCHDGFNDNNEARVLRIVGDRVEIVFLEGEKLNEIHHVDASELLPLSSCAAEALVEGVQTIDTVYQGLVWLFGDPTQSSDVIGVQKPDYVPNPIPGDPPPSLQPAPAPPPAPSPAPVPAPANSVSHPFDPNPPANAVFTAYEVTIVPDPGLIRIQYTKPIALDAVHHVHYLEDTHRVLVHFTNESGLGVRDLGVGIAPELWESWRTTPEIEFLRYEGGTVVEHRHARLVQGPPQGP